MKRFDVLSTTRRVVEKSDHVHIDERALLRRCRTWRDEKVMIPPWDDTHHFKGDPKVTAAYFLVLDSINFCFWAPAGMSRWEIKIGSAYLSGYIALAAALKRGVESGHQITRAETLAGLSMDELKHILGGQGTLQLLDERVRILNELGRVLIDAFGGEADRLILSARSSALRLAELLAEYFPSFRDIAQYQGETVHFLKRAQILAADLYGAFSGKRHGDFQDIHRLTAFADYKLPQVLRQLGILKYSDKLGEKIDTMVLLEAGSPMEVEIRANTIWAVERIRRELDRLGRSMMACEIDWALWNLGQQDAFRGKPYHRTVTTHY